jgi:hypothetical protein
MIRMETSQEGRLAYSVDEALARVPLSRAALYREMRRGALRWRRYGSRRLILADDLRQWLDTLPIGCPETTEVSGDAA